MDLLFKLLETILEIKIQSGACVYLYFHALAGTAKVKRRNKWIYNTRKGIASLSNIFKKEITLSSV